MWVGYFTNDDLLGRVGRTGIYPEITGRDNKDASGEPLAGSTTMPTRAILNQRLQTLLEKNTPYVKCLPLRPSAPG